MFYRYNNNHKSLVDLCQFLSPKYISHVHTITLKNNQKFHQLHRSQEQKNYLESCRDVVEMDHDIKQLEQCKRKIEDDLEEVNGQLSSLKKHYADMEKKNTCLRNAYVRKLKFSPVKAVKDKIDNRKSDITPDFEFEEINNDELVSACVEAEEVKENKVENVEVVYRRTGCNKWENMYSRILM